MSRRTLLRDGDLDVWTVDLDDAGNEQVTALLSAEDRAAGDRLLTEAHRRRFRVTRGALRWILAAHTGDHPQRLELAYGRRGKPGLPAHPGLHFSVSHSQGIALVAVTRRGPVGVDIEWIRPLDHLDDLLRLVLSPPERASLENCPPTVQRAAFFARWTSLEAVAKAAGDGLALVFDRRSRHQARRITPPCSLLGLAPASGYVAALALIGTDGQVRCHQWRADRDLGDRITASATGGSSG